MGGKEVDTTPPTIEEYFNKLFSYALTLGMSYEEYWFYDPYLLVNYIEADEIKTRRFNEKLWLQGLYNHIALNTSLSNAFSKNSHAKYPESPFPITKQEQEEMERKRVERIVRKLDSLVGKKLS